MSIAINAGTGSLQYDFTNLTNSGLLKAAEQLSSAGKISTTDESQLVGQAYGAFSVPVNGDAQSASQALEDPTKRNFVDIYTQHIASDEYFRNTQSAELDKSILSALNQYQTTGGPNQTEALSTSA